MIYCIWYPSGGFGHFVNAAISMYGEGFKRPKQSFVFSRSGNSHALDLVAPKFYPTTVHYDYEFDTDFNYTVLVDTGINNESTAFEDSFNDHKVIKIWMTNCNHQNPAVVSSIRGLQPQGCLFKKHTPEF